MKYAFIRAHREEFGVGTVDDLRHVINHALEVSSSRLGKKEHAFVDICSQFTHG